MDQWVKRQTDREKTLEIRDTGEYLVLNSTQINNNANRPRVKQHDFGSDKKTHFAPVLTFPFGKTVFVTFLLKPLQVDISPRFSGCTRRRLRRALIGLAAEDTAAPVHLHDCTRGASRLQAKFLWVTC